jgi:branched-chain amino acid transport system permease protein
MADATVDATDVDTAGATAPGASVAGIPVKPALPRPILTARIVFGVVLGAIALYAPWYFTPADNRVLSQALYLAIAAMGLNLLTGFNGQVSIGHGAFFGVGAFTTAILMDDHAWSFEATLPISLLLTAAIGVAVGFPALRVRGLQLALVTLGLAVLLPSVLNKYVKGIGNTPLVQPRSTGFSSLLDFLDNDQWMYYFCLAAVIVLFVAARNLMNSRTGRAMIATRDHELAAATVGVNLAATKVGAFAISAAYAGLAGSLSVMVEGQAVGNNPALYFQRSIEFLVAMVIGGTATIFGPLVGAFVLVVLRRNTEGLIEGKEILSPALYGAGLILIMYVLPEGIVGGVRRLTARFARRSPGTAAPADAPVWPPPDTSTG